MKGQIIQVSPFNFLSIMEYHSSLSLNEHGIATIKGFIKSDKEKQYLQLMSENVWTEIFKSDDNGGTSMLFCGIALEGRIKTYGDIKELTLKVITGSYLMDNGEHIRSFENEDETNGQVLKYLTSNYTDSNVVVNSKYDIKLGRYLCQYKETDWQLVKRIASNCSAVIIPNYMNKGVRYFFGLPDQVGCKAINDNEYIIKKDDGTTCYTVKRQEMYNLGERLYFQGRKGIVTKIRGEMEGNELYHYYELTEESGIRSKQIYNEKLVGVSLKATVVGVETDKVQLVILEDEYRTNVKKGYPYATVYSSPDGTGWYCMPEQGDSVRLYFPSYIEDEAFVMNAMHVESSNASERINPDYKSIMNKYGKEILITPSSLVFTNNAGMTVELSDNKGVLIVSDKQIEIKSEDEITLMSTQGKIDMAAQKEIILQQGNTSMVLSEKLRMQGARVKLE